jgi:hypothetical protein
MKNSYRPQIGEIDPAKALETLNEIRTKRALARRNFIKNVGLAGVGMAAGAIIDGLPPSRTPKALPQLTSLTSRSTWNISKASSTVGPPPERR